MKVLFVLLCITSIQLVCLGQEHPIDIENKACHDIDSNQTTYGMMQCESLAIDAWKAEMDKYLNLLVDTLSKDAGALLTTAQNTWLEYQSKEQQFSSNLYYSEMQGTMWRVVNAQRIKNLYKKRALELKEYYETYTYKGM